MERRPVHGAMEMDTSTGTRTIRHMGHRLHRLEAARLHLGIPKSVAHIRLVDRMPDLQGVRPLAVLHLAHVFGLRRRSIGQG